MRLNAEKLAERVAELSKVFQHQQEKFGAPGYDPTLLELLHNDLRVLKAELQEQDSMEKSQNKYLPNV